MFESKDLKQLRKTQLLIKECKTSIEKLNLPGLDSCKDSIKVYNVLRPILYGKSFSPGEFLELSDAAIEHIQQLGQYLTNITDYVDTRKAYEKQLRQLLREESILKEKLGIE
jgi:hypothetical protein